MKAITHIALCIAGIISTSVAVVASTGAPWKWD